jgi:hypothetical protein
MSYSFLLTSGITNTPVVPVGASNNGQIATLSRKSSTLDSVGTVSGGKATFNIPASRVNEFAGSYTIVVQGSVVQSGDIDVLTPPTAAPSSGGGTGNVDLSNYYTKAQTTAEIIANIVPKADKSYVDTQLGLKATTAALANYALTSTVNTALGLKANVTDLANYATASALSAKADTTAVTAALAGKVDASTFNTALANKPDSAALKTLAFSGLYTDITGTPDLANYTTNSALSQALLNKADSSAIAPFVKNVSGTVGDGQVTLTWTAPTDAFGVIDYTIQYRAVSSSTWVVVDHTASTATSIVITGLTNGTTYQFRVDPVRAFVATPLAPVVNAGAPAYAITSLRSVPVSATSATLTWSNTDPNSEVTAIKVSKNGTDVATLGKVTTWTDTSLSAGSQYIYGVRALDSTARVSTTSYDFASTCFATPGTYSVSGTRINKPDGTQFIPFGANIGVNQGIGGNNWSDESVSPHTKEALDWGWNTIRLTTYASRDINWIGTDASFVANKAYTTSDVVGNGGRKYRPIANFTSGASFNSADWTDLGAGYVYGRQKAINDTFTAAQKYVDAGFVVIITLMDVTQGVQTASTIKYDDMENFISQASLRFKNEPRVWININEPIGPTDGPSFTTWNQRYYDAWRANGNNNIYLADVMTNAQDAPWGGTKRVYDANYGPAFISGRTNVLFGYHNYGGLGENTDSQATFNTKYSNYFTSVQAAGLAMGIFEVGYTYNAVEQTTVTNDTNRNIRGTRASFNLSKSLGLGSVIWDGTFDSFTLKMTTDSGGYHGQGFWYQGAWADLSNMGLEFWNLCRPSSLIPPYAPTLTLGATNLTSQVLNWNRVVGATEYEVDYKRTADSSWTTITGTSIRKLTYTVTGLVKATAYDYRIRAKSNGGVTANSVTVSATTTIDTTAPTAPTTVTATPFDTTVSVAVSGATDAVGVTGFKVYSAATGGTLYVSGATSPLTVTGLTNGTAYTFYASAIDGSGNESVRTASNAVTPVAPAAGVRPTSSPTTSPNVWMHTDTITGSTGDTVTSAPAVVGNAFATNTNNGGTSPTLLANELAGKNVLKFTSASKNKMWSFRPAAATGRNSTYHCVARVNTLGANLLHGITSADAAGTMATRIQVNSSGGILAASFSAGGTAATTATGLITAGSWHIYSVVYNSTNILIYLDGVLVGTGTSDMTTTADSTLSYLALAGYGTGSNSIDYAEVVYHSSGLADADRKSWERYLAATHNLPVTN